MVSRTICSASFTVVQAAEPQNLMMQGVSFHLDEFQSEGNGGAVFDRDRVLPRTSSISVDMSMKMSADIQGQRQEMNMEMGMVMGMVRKKGE